MTTVTAVYRILAPLLAGILLIAFAAAAEAQGRRVALVIGNSDYQNVARLPNPENDASDVAAALGRIGFEVTLARDLDSVAMTRTLGAFARSSEGAEVALLFYAGHGMEIDGRNYLVPVDADLRSPLDVTYQTVDLDDLLRAVSGASALRLVMLDACRDNPFLAQMTSATRSLTRGLARVEPPPGVLVSYAARGGTVAFDGEGRNSPYTRALLQHLEEPGLEVGKLFRRVRDAVMAETGEMQEPFTYGSLPARDIYLAGALPPVWDDAAVIRDFTDAVLKNSVAGWRQFLDMHEGTGAKPELIATARRNIETLEAGVDVAGVAPPPASSRESVLTRACDGLAADPDDHLRPEGVAGVALEAIEARPALSACRIAVEGHPDLPRMRYQFARALQASEGIRAARDAYEAAVQMGYPAAAAHLGAALANASGLPRDTQAGLALLDQAFEGGSPVAPRYLGEFTTSLFAPRRQGERTPLDYFRIGAERGDMISAFEAGYRLVSATTATPADVAAGLRHLEAAAQAGVPGAHVRLARYYLDAKAGNDPARGIAHFEAAAEAGDRYAQNQLRKIYRDGGPVAPDAQKAAKWVLFAAAEGSSRMMAEAGYLHEIGLGVSKDPVEAARYYMRSLEARDVAVYRRRAEDWDRDTARALQRLLQLSDRARYTGPLDGLIGAGSRAAMARVCLCSRTTATLRFADLF